MTYYDNAKPVKLTQAKLKSLKIPCTNLK